MGRIGAWLSSLGLVVGTVFVVGCSGRALSGGGGDAGSKEDGGTRDAFVQDGGTRDAFVQDGGALDGAPPGFVVYVYGDLEHRLSFSGPESLTFSVGVYETPYEPKPGDQDGYVGTEQTLDGVPCDIYYTKGMQVPPRPQPPAQVNVGPFRVTGDEGGSYMGVRFSDNAYSSANLSGDQIPGWADDDTLGVVFRHNDFSSYPSFQASMELAGHPWIIFPRGEELYLQDGGYKAAWTDPADADLVEVVFQFNLDWDDSAFICHPPVGGGQLLLPESWIEDYTWGSGHMIVRGIRRLSGQDGTNTLWYRFQVIRSSDRQVRFARPIPESSSR